MLKTNERDRKERYEGLITLQHNDLIVFEIEIYCILRHINDWTRIFLLIHLLYIESEHLYLQLYYLNEDQRTPKCSINDKTSSISEIVYDKADLFI